MSKYLTALTLIATTLMITACGMNAAPLMASRAT